MHSNKDPNGAVTIGDSAELLDDWQDAADVIAKLHATPPDSIAGEARQAARLGRLGRDVYNGISGEHRSDLAFKQLNRKPTTRGIEGVNKNVPAPRLVGVESNPGPGKLDRKLNEAYHAEKKARKLLEAKKRTKPFKLPDHPRGESAFAAPTAYGVTHAGTQPVFRRTGADLVVSHTELATIVTNRDAGGNFNLQEFPISATSPIMSWFSTTASGYERYRIEELEFFYNTSIATTNEGTVALGVDYDPLDDPPESMSEMALMRTNIAANVWCPEFRLRVDPKALRGLGTWLDVGSTAPENREPHLNTAGNLTIAVEGCFLGSATAPAVIGRLYVRYKVRLTVPHSTVDGMSAPYMALGPLTSPTGEPVTHASLVDRFCQYTRGLIDPAWLATYPVADVRRRTGGCYLDSYVVDISKVNIQPRMVGRYMLVHSRTGSNRGHGLSYAPLRGVKIPATGYELVKDHNVDLSVNVIIFDVTIPCLGAGTASGLQLIFADASAVNPTVDFFAVTPLAKSPASTYT